MQFVADNLEHNTNTMDVNVPSVGWALLLVQSSVRICLKIEVDTNTFKNKQSREKNQ